MQVALNEIAEKMGEDYNTIPEDVRQAFLEEDVEGSLNIRISELQFFVKKMEEIIQKLLELSGLNVKGVKRVLITASGYEIQLHSEALISFVKKYGFKVSKFNRYVIDGKDKYIVWVAVDNNIMLSSVVRKEVFEQYFKV
jgi:hypothetical protein